MSTVCLGRLMLLTLPRRSSRDLASFGSSEQVYRHVVAGGAGITAASLVGTLYRDRYLTHELRQAATETIYNHLRHLAEKGRVRAAGSAFGISTPWVLST